MPCGMASSSALAVLRFIAKVKCVGCSNGKSAGLDPLEDAVDQPGNQISRLRSIGAIGHQTAIPDEAGMFIHRRDAVDGGELENPLAVQHTSSESRQALRLTATD